mmetsp:Transcript_20933/g.41705  ORF Transcript_20933/g.41705 Transcript_20933/m.41705 type:complete len:707 (+) Transcript_20933:59-2179(+)
MVTVVKPSQPTEAVGAGRKGEFFGSQSQSKSYMDDEASSYEEARDDGNDIVREKSIEVVHTGESAEPDDNTPDENVAPASIQQNSLRSPKILSKTMSKLKPFTSPMRRAKPNHFFNESFKSVSSPKKVAMKVLSPRAAPSPKKAPVEKKKVVEKVSLAVAPGKLGLSLKMDKQRGGALIVSIHPRCAFHGRTDVGDRIVYIDDRRVKHMDDFKVDSDKKRNFIIRRNSKDASNPASSVPNGQESKENVTTEPDGPPDDLSHQFSLVEMNSSVTEGTYPEEEEEDPQTQTVPALLSPTQSFASNRSKTTQCTTLTKEEHVLNQFEANQAPRSKFNCAQGNGIVNEFISDRFSCAGTVRSDDTTSIKTLLKPIASLMECGQAHVTDYASGIYTADIVEPAKEMSREAPTIKQISQLQISDHAFIKRSNGGWTYSTVLDVEKNSITFSVDEFGNGKTITKHRWLSSIRLVKSAEDEEDAEDDAESTVAEEYSMSISSSGSDDYSEDASPLASPVASPSAADMKAQLKAKLQKKKMDLKAKKKDMKRQAQQAKAAAAEAKRNARELKEAQELELKLRLMDLEEMKLKQEEEVERERMADLEEFKKKKLAKIEADYEEKRRKKLAKKKAALELEKEVEKERLRIIEEKKAKKKADHEEKKKKEEAKVEMKRLQKANQQAAALEAQRQAELVFQNLEATMMATEISKKYQSS